YWFVPGGRIYKGESIAAAIARISQAELGFAIDLEDTQYLGLYEHFYQTSSFDEGVSTHYVVNAFECQLKRFGGSLALPEDQHSDYQWLSVPELLDDESVHRYSRWYFQPGVGVKP
ncbi:MAG: NUDIX domain-containing protein, partial [Cellvibrionaceae bacterium]|nr:NUDIX domain-containing protein [Cellvibrionaceae bacterium]